MDRFEMIEKLRARADVTYEEAKEVLEQADGDLLEAVVILEKQGRLRQPKETAGQTDAAAAADRAADQAAVKAAEKTGAAAEKKKRERGPISKAVRKIVNFITNTAFHIKHKDKEIFVMPSWAAALLLFFFWHTLVPVIIISLFFGVRYFFDGAEDVTAANDVLEKAGYFADGVESSMKKHREEKNAQVNVNENAQENNAQSNVNENAQENNVQSNADENAQENGAQSSVNEESGEANDADSSVKQITEENAAEA